MIGGVDLEKPGTSRDVDMVTADYNNTDIEENMLIPSPEMIMELTAGKKRQKGRPPGVTSTRIRTRESTRLKKKPTVTHFGYDDKLSYEWSVKEKQQLLKGLQAVGDVSVKLLKTYVPGRTEHDIRNQIRMWKTFAVQEVKRKCEYDRKRQGKMTVIENIDTWLKYFGDVSIEDSPRLFALSKVFCLISEFGTFPTPEESDGVDFRAMYRYIHCMLNGLPFYGMNSVTARLVNQCLSDLSRMVRDQNIIPELQTILANATAHPPTSTRTYTRMQPASTNVQNLWSHPDTNPLNVPPTFLKKDVVDKSSDED